MTPESTAFPRRPTDDGWIRVNRTILIVDDDPGIRRLIATTLEDVSGYRMTEAGDGEEAVEAARSASRRSSSWTSTCRA